MDPVHRVHVKLLACDLLSLVPSSSSSSLLRPRPRPRPPLPISRAETLGVVVLRERRPLLLSFLVDDGSGCVPCVLWLNHLHRRHFSASTSAAPPLDVVLAAEAAAERADAVRLGALVRVRGRVGVYRGAVQITVADVVVERDPNAEVLHWLDCIRLARDYYDVA
ncbi:CST complex subunit STN1 [Ananas comosus]|uniref:CST complex subunit STN1 n=1 Tax=Ananas comosus TaxID=4615 RepID=A0A6P5GPP4_ANACO|nr:CST complex subunit STN1 [Ananas comosus]XP_020107989.1 CST complex subunit STN1 [Ananas comosus]